MANRHLEQYVYVKAKFFMGTGYHLVWNIVLTLLFRIKLAVP